MSKVVSLFDRLVKKHRRQIDRDRQEKGWPQYRDVFAEQARRYSKAAEPGTDRDGCPF